MDGGGGDCATTFDSAHDSQGGLGLNLLSTPNNPLIDLIFVHGLGGSVRNTWTSKADRAFWPDWLSQDACFSTVRFSSYGYSAKWNKDRANCLNIHHLGKALLAAIATSPEMKSSCTCIILLGHSMGGLVIKKAYVLACQEPELLTVAQRIQAIYFLATPHRGSDLAKLLRTVLRVFSISRGYVNDIVKSSATLHWLHDEFHQNSRQLELWSFYETQKMRSNGVRILVVDPESATLGFPAEMQVPLNTDHHNICKFSSRMDPNYILVRNALATTVANLEAGVNKTGATRVSLDEMRTYLGLTADLDEDLSTVRDQRMTGTCEWVRTQPWYSNWTASEKDIDRPVVWIAGMPATGKSTLSSFLIDSLRDKGKHCSFHFFKRNDSSKSKLSFCLRALMLQMACQDDTIWRSLEQLVVNGSFLDLENERNLWRALFEPFLFQESRRAHYWVIDGLDECANPMLLVKMLSKTENLFGLRILITSVENAEVQDLFCSLQDRYCRQHIRQEDTQLDIEKLVLARTQAFTFLKSEDIQSLANQIMEKANGSLLWSRLVLDEMSQCYSKRDIIEVLNEIPLGMKSLYHRALKTISQASRGKKLAEAILTWVACVFRPLTVEELKSALELDLDDQFHNLEEKLGSICGHLVVVNRSKRVQFVHETARRFLLESQLQPEFSLQEQTCHERIARVCLAYLSTDTANLPLGGRRRRAQSFKESFSTVIASQYICEEFSNHFLRAKDSAIALLPLLDTFLRFNILSWIEITASERNLGRMIRVAKHLKSFVDQYTSNLSPLRKDVRAVRGWAVDLHRIAAKFHTALSDSPSSIHSVIAPFCPAGAVIRNIRVPGPRLNVTGPINGQWDDRLTSVNFREGMPNALAHGEDFFAVGFIKGLIILYHSNSCQEYRSLNAAETMDLLSFKAKSSLLAVAGFRSTQVWNVRTGQMLFCFKTQGRSLGIAFSGSNLLVASVKNVLSTWELGDDAKQLAQETWRVQHKHQSSELPKRQPSALSIGLAHGLLAVAHSNFPITLWDIQDNTLFGTCGKTVPDASASMHRVIDLVFNPNPNIPLLAVSYLDGELAIIDLRSDDEIAKLRFHSHTLAASPDGRFLAGSAGGGTIQIFEFETLRLLYKINSTDSYIRSLAFSFDGAQLIDLRLSQCNVWRPPILVADDIEDDTSIGTCATAVETPLSAPKSPISSMTVLSDGYIVCGKVGGAVDLYDGANGAFLHQLYTEPCTIRHLIWIPQENCLLSVNLGNNVSVTTVEQLPKVGWQKKTRRLHRHVEAVATITQVLVAKSGKKFILCNELSDFFWDIEEGEQSQRNYTVQSKSRLWCEHPASTAHMLMADGTTVKVFSWADWTAVCSVSQAFDVIGTHVRLEPATGLRAMLLEIRDADRGATVTDVRMLQSTALPHETTTTLNFEIVRLNFGNLLDNMRFVIGVLPPKTMLFLDGHSWVCSVDISNATEPVTTYCRHFFIPYDWFAGVRLPAVATRGSDIILAKHDEVAIIQGGLGHTEVIPIA